ACDPRRPCGVAFRRRVRRSTAARDQQPVVAPVAIARAHAHEHEAAMEALAVELEDEMAVAIARMRVADRRPGAVIPDVDMARTVVAFGNVAVEPGIRDRMVLDMHGEALLAGRLARLARDGPALQHTVQLEAKVVVQAPRL